MGTPQDAPPGWEWHADWRSQVGGTTSADIVREALLRAVELRDALALDEPGSKTTRAVMLVDVLNAAITTLDAS